MNLFDPRVGDKRLRSYTGACCCAACGRLFGTKQAVFSHYGQKHHTVRRWKKK